MVSLRSQHFSMRKAFVLMALLVLFAGPVLEAQHNHDAGDETAECLLCQKSSDSEAHGDPLHIPAELAGNTVAPTPAHAAVTGFSTYPQARGPPKHS